MIYCLSWKAQRTTLTEFFTSVKALELRTTAIIESQRILQEKWINSHTHEILQNSIPSEDLLNPDSSELYASPYSEEALCISVRKIRTPKNKDEWVRLIQFEVSLKQ